MLVNQIKTIILLFASLLIGCSATSDRGNAHATEQLTKTLSAAEIKSWRQDLDYLKSELEKRHINLYHTISKDQFSQYKHQLKQALPSLNHYQTTVELMRLLRHIGDGHTSTGWWHRPWYRYPFRLMLINDQLRIIATSDTYQQWLGARITAIDGHDIQDVISKISDISPTGAENQYALIASVEWTANVADVLYGLGISDKLLQAKFEVEFDGGTRQSIMVNAVAHTDFKTLIRHQLPKPNYIDFQPLIETDGIAIQFHHQTKTALIQFSSYPSYWDMYWFGEDLIEHFNQLKVEYLIIDLRNNGGGNFFVGLFLAQELIIIDSIDWNNGVYVLTNHHTFSAGSSNAAQFRQILNATIVGQPTGGNPYGYQDADSFLLPNSAWQIQYSKRLFRFQDKATDGVIPDVSIEPQWENIKAGKDVVFEWVFNKINH